MVFREQQKLDSSYLSYLIYHEATFIVNTAGGKGGGGGGGGGYKKYWNWDSLSCPKEKQQKLLPTIPPSLAHESRLSAMQLPPITFRKRSMPPLVTKPFVIIDVIYSLD